MAVSKRIESREMGGIIAVFLSAAIKTGTLLYFTRILTLNLAV